MTIYIVTHKEVPLENYKLDKCYKVIGVGEYAKNAKENICRDNTGLNISEKNANYCELTALYWIWKNDTSDVVGLVHYRRYFTKALISNSSRYFLKEKDIDKILNRYDAIVGNRTIIAMGAYSHYLKGGYKKDLEHVKEAIKKISPEYLTYYEKYFEHSAGFRPCNMIITRKDILNNYCKWLFNILDYVEKITDLDGYTPQQKRIYGYISERLLDVWLNANHIKCKSMKVINTDEKFNLKYILRYTKVWAMIKLLKFNQKSRMIDA